MQPRIVLANGVFDVFHYGHLLHLQAARRMGTQLIVAVTRNLGVNKGPGRPVFDETQRAELIANLRIVDGVYMSADALEALDAIKPDVFVKGSDYKGKIRPQDVAYCHSNGIEIAFTDEQTYSSTRIINDRLLQG